jgi:hypothetical protein
MSSLRNLLQGKVGTRPLADNDDTTYDKTRRDTKLEKGNLLTTVAL